MQADPHVKVLGLGIWGDWVLKAECWIRELHRRTPETRRRGSLDQHKLMRNLHKPEERATQKHYREGYQSSDNNPRLQSRKLHIHGEFEKAHRRIWSRLPKLKSETQKDPSISE